MSEDTRILIVEDSQGDMDLAKRELCKSLAACQFLQVTTRQEFIEALDAFQPDLVIADYRLPNFDGMTALQLTLEQFPFTPVIIWTGSMNEDVAVESMRAGASNYIIKENIKRLGPAVLHALHERQMHLEHQRTEEALQEKEYLLAEAQRIAHIGSWSYEIDSDSLNFSDEMYRLLDTSPTEFQHRAEDMIKLVYSTDRPLVRQWMKTLANGSQVKELDFRVLLSNYELRFVHFRGAIVFDDSGKPQRYIGTAQDVTDRKLAEIQIRQQVERLTALRKIDQVITSSIDLRVTLDTLLTHLTAQLQVDAADILLLNSNLNTLEYAAARGFHTNSIERTHLRMGESYAGQVALERRMVKIPNLRDRSDNRILNVRLTGENFVCYFGVPLIARGKVKGVLEIFHRTPLQPFEEWFDFLNMLAGQAAIAIDNAILFDDLQSANNELIIAYDATIEGWSRAMDLRDKETEGHTQRVTTLTINLARALGVPESEIIHIRRGGLLHDIGKLGVPDEILLKPGKLTEAEWGIMRQHPQLAYDMLKRVDYLEPALDIPYCHHEKWDGTGYPRGLKGEEIPFAARIFAVADVWDALTSKRPYRSAWPINDALRYIKSEAGKHFDPKVVEVFLKSTSLWMEAE